MFNQNHKIIGQLYGRDDLQDPDCDDLSGLSVEAGKLSVSWSNGLGTFLGNATEGIYPFPAAPEIYGAAYICANGTEFEVEGLPTGGAMVTWNKSTNVSFATGYNEHDNPCRFKTVNGLPGEGWMKRQFI